jgi:solute carrier family 7 (cationic amino acid transporter), member 1
MKNRTAYFKGCREICVLTVLDSNLYPFVLFCRYLRCFVFAIGGVLLLSSSILLLCIGQHKSSSRQTEGIGYDTWAFSTANLVKYGLKIQCILKSSISLLGFMCPCVPLLPICCIIINVYLLMSIR